MARTVAFLAVAAVVVAVAHASCVPSQCQFTLTPTSGSAKAFDLSSMCTGSDYTITYKDFTCTLLCCDCVSLAPCPGSAVPVCSMRQQPMLACLTFFSPTAACRVGVCFV